MGSRGKTQREDVAKGERETIAKALQRMRERGQRYLDKSGMA
jgi:hypothetical protein